MLVSAQSAERKRESGQTKIRFRFSPSRWKPQKIYKGSVLALSICDARYVQQDEADLKRTPSAILRKIEVIWRSHNFASFTISRRPKGIYALAPHHSVCKLEGRKNMKILSQ